MVSGCDAAAHSKMSRSSSGGKKGEALESMSASGDPKKLCLPLMTASVDNHSFSDVDGRVISWYSSQSPPP
jgi:hypothetical protein